MPIDHLDSVALSHPRSGPREFLLGQTLRASILTTGEETEGRHDLTDSWLPPGQPTPLHRHTRYDERFWVVSGELRVWAGSEHFVLGSGEYVAIAKGTPHVVEAGSDGCRALQISSPAAFAELVQRAGTPSHLATPDTELDMDLFMSVTTALGDEVLGPPGTKPTD